MDRIALICLEPTADHSSESGFRPEWALGRIDLCSSYIEIDPVEEFCCAKCKALPSKDWLDDENHMRKCGRVIRKAVFDGEVEYNTEKAYKL
jgi:hypothetical protein